MSPLAYVMRGAILIYRYTFSAFLGSSCRFRPTCSEYALDVIRLHGAVRGGWLAAKRLCRCNPWGSSGFDPAPQPFQRPDSINSALDDTPRAKSCCASNHPGNRLWKQRPSAKAQRETTLGHTAGDSPGNSTV